MLSDNDIYFLYKPFKNQLSKVNLFDSLFVIWAYINNIDRNKPLPAGFEKSSQFLYPDKVAKRRLIQEHHLEVLARELFVTSYVDIKEKTFQKWDYFAGTLGKLRELENILDKEFLDKEKNNIYFHLIRLANNQFPWQESNSLIDITRYYKIFNNKFINELVKNKYGITYEKISIIGIILYGIFTENFTHTLPITSQIKNIDSSIINKFLEIFATDVKNMQEKINGARKIDKNFFYSRNPLRDFPLILTNYQGTNHLVCPIIQLFFWRITKGIFYLLVNEKGFDKNYGDSFEKYSIDVIRKANKNEQIKFYKQKQYGKDCKRPVDLIIEDKTAMLFIECKTKRLPIKAMKSKKEFEAQLDILVDGIIQIYKFYNDYKNNKYPYKKYNSRKPIYPILLTLENWYMFGHYFVDMIDSKVKEKLVLSNLDAGLTDKMPISICSIAEFEQLVQIIQNVSIDVLMNKKLFASDFRYWAFANFLANQFMQDTDKCESLFDDELNIIINRYKNKKTTN